MTTPWELNTRTPSVLGPPSRGTRCPLKEISTAPALPVQKTIWSVAWTVFMSFGLIMPRTVYFPSDLIDTQARSLARIVTSNCEASVVEGAAATAGGLGFVISGGVASSGLRAASLDFTGAFKSTGVFAPGVG